MNRDRLEELWSRFLAGEELPAADERILLDALEADPALRRNIELFMRKLVADLSKSDAS